MVQLKEVLNLYLGCEGKLGSSEIIFTLSAVQSVSDLIVVRSSNDSRQGQHVDPKNFKPILRKLESMTEEEFNEFKICADNDFAKMIVIESMSKDGDYTRLCHQATSQAYLLSKHFDLFNLISSSQAIDKETLTNKK